MNNSNAFGPGDASPDDWVLMICCELVVSISNVFTAEGELSSPDAVRRTIGLGDEMLEHIAPWVPATGAGMTGGARGLAGQERERPELSPRPLMLQTDLLAYEHPLVEPQVSHFMQVPLRTMV